MLTAVLIAWASVVIWSGRGDVGLVDAAGDAKPHVRVTTVLEIPYVQLRNKNANPPTNDDFDGFIPQLLKELQKESKTPFDYTIKLAPDKLYGKLESNGQWSGMMGELVRDNADLAVAAITVSDKRREVVDFLDQFMTFDTAILMKKSSSTPNIKSLSDLENQNEVTYGAIGKGVTESYIRDNPDRYSKMWAHMSAGSGTSVSNATEGVERVRKGIQKADGTTGPFAFLTEGPTAEYYVNQDPCDLVSVNVEMVRRGYALAAKKNWPLKADINSALQRLNSTKKLENLRRQWWSGTCSGADGLVVQRVFGVLSASVTLGLMMVMTSLPVAGL